MPTQDSNVLNNKTPVTPLQYRDFKQDLQKGNAQIVANNIKDFLRLQPEEIDWCIQKIVKLQQPEILAAILDGAIANDKKLYIVSKYQDIFLQLPEQYLNANIAKMHEYQRNLQLENYFDALFENKKTDIILDNLEIYAKSISNTFDYKIEDLLKADQAEILFSMYEKNLVDFTKLKKNGEPLFDALLVELKNDHIFSHKNATWNAILLMRLMGVNWQLDENVQPQDTDSFSVTDVYSADLANYGNLRKHFEQPFHGVITFDLTEKLHRYAKLAIENNLIHGLNNILAFRFPKQVVIKMSKEDIEKKAKQQQSQQDTINSVADTLQARSEEALDELEPNLQTNNPDAIHQEPFVPDEEVLQNLSLLSIVDTIQNESKNQEKQIELAGINIRNIKIKERISKPVLPINDVSDAEKTTLLHHAALTGSIAVCELLIKDFRAEIRQDSFNNDPIAYAKREHLVNEMRHQHQSARARELHTLTRSQEVMQNKMDYIEKNKKQFKNTEPQISNLAFTLHAQNRLPKITLKPMQIIQLVTSVVHNNQEKFGAILDDANVQLENCEAIVNHVAGHQSFKGKSKEKLQQMMMAYVETHRLQQVRSAPTFQKIN